MRFLNYILYFCSLFLMVRSAISDSDTDSPCLFGLAPTGTCEDRECPIGSTCVRGVCCPRECPTGKSPLQNETCGGIAGFPCPGDYVCLPEQDCCDFFGKCCENPCPGGHGLVGVDCAIIDQDPPCPKGYVCKRHLNGGKGICCGCDSDEKRCPDGETIVKRNPENKCRFDKCPACYGRCLVNKNCKKGMFCKRTESTSFGTCCPVPCTKTKGKCLNSQGCPQGFYCQKKHKRLNGICCKNPCKDGDPTQVGCGLAPCPKYSKCKENAFSGNGACCREKCKQSDKYKTTICIKDDCITGTCEEIAAKSMKFKKKLCRKDKKGKCCKTCGAS